MGISPATVKREWSTAKAWMNVEEAERGMLELIRGRAPSAIELLAQGSIDLRREVTRPRVE